MGSVKEQQIKQRFNGSNKPRPRFSQMGIQQEVKLYRKPTQLLLIVKLDKNLIQDSLQSVGSNEQVSRRDLIETLVNWKANLIRRQLTQGLMLTLRIVWINHPPHFNQPGNLKMHKRC